VSRRAGTGAVAVLSLLALTGCEEKRNFPAGFEEAAAQGAPAEASTAARPGASLGGAGGSAGGSARGDAPPDAPPNAARDAASPAAEAVADAPDAPPPPVVTAEDVARELRLPAAPEVAVPEGEEPHQKHARDPRFEGFRRMSARFIQLRREMLPYGRKLADGTATPADRRIHDRLQDASDQEFKRLNAYMWDDRWSDDDRAAMGWILFGGLQPGGPK